MKYSKTDNTYIIKLERGERVLETLTSFCEKEDINNALFSGIGAVEKLTCGYYALDEKKYYFTDYPELVEVVSSTGNVAVKDGNPFIHMHGVFTNHQNNAFGGHIQEMTVGVTLEVFLHVYDTAVDRQLDEDIGLFLLNCEN